MSYLPHYFRDLGKRNFTSVIRDPLFSVREACQRAPCMTLKEQLENFGLGAIDLKLFRFEKIEGNG